MILRKPLLLCITTLPLFATGGCHAEPSFSSHGIVDPALQQRIDALKEKTLKNLVAIEGGKFLMGDFGPMDPRVNLPYSGDRNDDVLHEVTLSDYSLGAYKVTYEDFDIFTAAMGKPKIAQQEMDLSYRDLPNMAAGVDWNDAQAYCQWIGREIGRKMDLPTEAQWEFAARNRGQFIVWPTDNGAVDDGRNVANYESYAEFEAKHNTRSYFSSIGLYPSTPLGLYDMIDHGFEWVIDWYSPSYESTSARDPHGPSSGTEKVQRGHLNRGGDSLAIVSMTMTRFHSLPSPPPKMSPLDQSIIPINPNRSNTFRCAAGNK